MKVRAKKHLGQHFLNDLSIAKRIAYSLTGHGSYVDVLEIGPGTGALTQFLLEQTQFTTTVAEVDTESIEYLKIHLPALGERILNADFLHMPFDRFQGKPFAVAGNFPYNISSQIMFRVYDHRNQIPEVVGMFQKEVAQRICEKPGSKDYGILSVLLQAYYHCEYLFTVSEGVFTPPPKVKSGVIRLRRNDRQQLPCDEAFFKTVVKTAFNQRRKTLRNSVKSLNSQLVNDPILDKRPEQLGVEEFIYLTQLLAS
ncbi:MAG TPA: 16S rRNA (adenine(1518)-N(6)/adenine(1519)-N(6))-dimethyltransferase RsmA [Luteibaculaceae bacterium]|nr:16S rRNA (adenine(1518)-N(6)/adenine(1519)-N(6))-dimethyltransferase RsmA [Luteibaculaceae bacterium]